MASSSIVSRCRKAMIVHPDFPMERDVKILTRVRKCIYFEDPLWKKVGKLSIVAGVIGYVETHVRKSTRDVLKSKMEELRKRNEENVQFMKAEIYYLKVENAQLKEHVNTGFARLEEADLKNQKLLADIRENQKRSRWWG